MELRHLRYFVVTAELEHFGRAAARLSIVQPALSKQIRELEAELGMPLFERLARGVRLTAAGRAFFADAKRLLQDTAAATERARATAVGRRGELRIGFVDTAIYHQVLPRLFARFRREFPDVRLELVQQTSANQGALLRDGSLDLGFVFHLPRDIDSIASHFIVAEPIRLAVPADHPFARRRSVKLRELRDADFVWISRQLSPRFHDGVFAACAKHGFTPRIVQEGGTDFANLSLVAAGVGLSFSVASAERRKPAGVTLVTIADLDFTVRLEACWRVNNPNPALPHFVALLPRSAQSKR